MKNAMGLLIVVLAFAGCTNDVAVDSTQRLTEQRQGYTVTTIQDATGVFLTRVTDAEATLLASMETVADLSEIRVELVGLGESTRVDLGDNGAEWALAFESELAFLNDLAIEAVLGQDGGGEEAYLRCNGGSYVCLLGDSWCFCCPREGC